MRGILWLGDGAHRWIGPPLLLVFMGWKNGLWRETRVLVVSR